jgi:hypothetical protein
MAIDDVYQVTVRSTLLSQVYMNRMAFIRTVGSDVSSAEVLAVGNAMKDIHRASQIQALSYTTYEARQVRGTGVTYPSGADCQPVGGLYFDGALTGTLGGAAVDVALPPQCAMVTTLRTGQIGRRRRGRFYAPGFGEGQQANGAWDTALTTTVSTAWSAFLAAWAVAAPVGGFRLGVWSVREATGCEPNPATGEHVRVDPPSPSTAFTPVIASITRTPVFTQRRRRVGVGI